MYYLSRFHSLLRCSRLPPPSPRATSLANPSANGRARLHLAVNSRQHCNRVRTQIDVPKSSTFRALARRLFLEIREHTRLTPGPPTPRRATRTRGFARPRTTRAGKQPRHGKDTADTTAGDLPLVALVYSRAWTHQVSPGVAKPLTTISISTRREESEWPSTERAASQRETFLGVAQKSRWHWNSGLK